MRKRSLLSVVTLAALGAALTAGDSSEAAMTAFDGHALNPGDASCFSASTAGIVTNICSGSRRYCVSDYITSSGGHPVRIDGFRPNGGSLSCFSNAVNEFGTIVSFTGIKSLNVVNQSAALALGTVNVPSYGSLMVCCDLSTGASFETANF